MRDVEGVVARAAWGILRHAPMTAGHAIGVTQRRRARSAVLRTSA